MGPGSQSGAQPSEDTCRQEVGRARGAERDTRHQRVGQQGILRPGAAGDAVLAGRYQADRSRAGEPDAQVEVQPRRWQFGETRTADGELGRQQVQHTDEQQER